MFPICLLACFYNFFVVIFLVPKAFNQGHQKVRRNFDMACVSTQVTTGKRGRRLVLWVTAGKVHLWPKSHITCIPRRASPQISGILTGFLPLQQTLFKAAQRNVNDLRGSAHSGGGGGCWMTAGWQQPGALWMAEPSAGSKCWDWNGDWKITCFLLFPFMGYFRSGKWSTSISLGQSH